MGSKYQFRERGQDYSFENKNVFINHCQHKYQKSLNYSNPSEYYSYDFGETWNLISNFKSERQTIQNEKKPQNEIRNHSTKSESKLDQSSGVPTWVLIILTPIILFGVYYYANQNNQNKVPRTENNTETNTPMDMDSSIDVNNDEPIQNEVNSQTESTENYYNEDNTESLDNNSQTESNDNSSSNTYQEPEREKQQPEKVKCYSCRGSGDCGKCSKTCSKPYYQGNGSYKWRNETKQGYTMCQDCFGRGHKQSHVVGGSGWEPNGDCYVSDCEDGWVNCRECNGSGNGTLLGKCRDCKGTGYRN